ncbi:MAG: hypothetical protein ACFFDY_00060 [Candidatus Thorarchaeota archaeon]
MEQMEKLIGEVENQMEQAYSYVTLSEANDYMETPRTVKGKVKNSWLVFSIRLIDKYIKWKRK